LIPSDAGTAQKERAFWGKIRAALKARIANYDFQRKHVGFNPNTFDHVDLPTGKETAAEQDAI
jgi:hypothetical protein